MFWTDHGLEIDRVPCVAELAVHKRKVSEVASWIKDFAHHGKVPFSVPAPPFLVALRCFVLFAVLDTGLIQKLLVLSGPAGSGKSTTIFSLAKEMDVQIIEWINPVDEAKLTTQTEGPSSPHPDIPSPGSAVLCFIVFSSQHDISRVN